MDESDKRIVDILKEDDKALIIGQEVLYPAWRIGDREIHFTAIQNRFLYAIQYFKGDIEKSCQFVKQDQAWATRFLASKKFREFRNAKICAMSVRNGDLVEWWWQFGMDGSKGFRDYYEGHCGMCKEKNLYKTTEIEMTRSDDMIIHATCKVCLQPLEVEYKKEDFKPTREQVQFWQEIGNRVSPKIERVHHEFNSETFVFNFGG